MLIAVCVAASNAPWRRNAGSSAAVLALLMLVVPMFAAVKSQASHYFFPGLLFAPIWLALVVPLAQLHQLKRLGVSGVLIGVLVVTFYRPDAIWRLLMIKEFEQDLRSAAELERADPGGRTMLALVDGARLLWLSGRSSPSAVISTDVQFPQQLRRDPDLLLRALGDQTLTLVLFDPNARRLDAPQIATDPVVSEALAAFGRQLTERFHRGPTMVDGQPAWTRR